jgi:hypothetical protein
MIVDGGSLSFTNSGELLRGRTSDSQLLEPPLLDSLHENDIGNEEYLLGHSMDEGVVSIAGAVMNSGDRLQLIGEDREEVKEFGVEEENKKITAELQAILYGAVGLFPSSP